MSLSGQQRKKLRKALMLAFPDTFSLEKMLSDELDTNLKEVAAEGSLEEILFRLIQRAKAEGWDTDLIRAAHSANPNFPLSDYPLQDTAQTVEITQQKVWNIPSKPTRFFTGRETVLLEMRNALLAEGSAALHGLGGMGKTQTALEYADRYRDEYQMIMWVNASDRSELVSGFIKLAELLKLLVNQENGENVIIDAVKDWLETHSGWLLIMDNADETAILDPFLPVDPQGHLLLTTRDPAPGIYQSLKLEKLSSEEGALLLLRRAGLISKQAGLDEVSESERILAETISREMDGLPLALDQAGAYIAETPSLAKYLKLYKAERKSLLEERGKLPMRHESVAVTFSLAFKKVLERSPAAADLIRVSTFLAPDAIPEEIFTVSAAELGENLSQVANKPLDCDNVIREAGRLSLISRNPNETFDIHRLVQEVLKAEMGEDNCRLWAERTVCAVTHVFPNAKYAKNWRICERLLPHARSAINWSEQYQFESKTAALLLHRTGYYLSESGHYSEAEPFYQKALSLYKRLLGEDHPDLVEYINNLVELYDAKGRFKDAEDFAQESLRILDKTDNSSVLQLATSLHNLALVYESQGRYSEAIPYYEKALNLKLKTLGKLHLDVAKTLNNLATVNYSIGQYNYSIGQYESVEDLHKRALEIRIRLSGQEAPIVAQSLNNLGMLYEDMERYAESEKKYREAQHIFEESLGKEHPFLAINFNNLARLYCLQGKLEDSEKFSEKALEILDKAFNLKHPFAAYSLSNLGQLRSNQKLYPKAEELYNQALSILSETVGSNHPEVAKILNNLAFLYATRDPDNAKYNPKQAEQLYKQAINIQSNALPKHPEHAKFLSNLALLYRNLCQFEKAENLFQTAIEISTDSLGSENIAVAVYIHNLAFLYGDIDKFDEAKKLYKQAINICEQKLGVDNPLRIQMLYNYSKLLYKLDGH